MTLLPSSLSPEQALYWSANHHNDLCVLIEETMLEIEHALHTEEYERRLLAHILATSQSMMIRECDNYTLNIVLSKNSQYVFQSIGHVVLFCINEPFEVVLHRISADQNYISDGELITVTKSSPLLINGNHNTYYLQKEGTLFGLINLPDLNRSKLAGLDIRVYSLESQQQVFWFPYDGSVARYLFVLKALSDNEDPLRFSIAEELLAHPSPQVKATAKQFLNSHKPRDILAQRMGSKQIASPLSLDEFVCAIDKIDCLDSVEAEDDICNLLLLLAQNPSLLGDFVAKEIHSKGFDYQEAYNHFLFNLHQSSRYVLRLTFWEPLNSDAEKPTFIYDIKHNHDFKLFTINYSGDGYHTIIAQTDTHPTTIVEGKLMNILGTRDVKLSKDRVTILNAYSDIHVQFPPNQLSSSLALIIPDARRLSSWDFDDNYRAKASGLAYAEHQIFTRISSMFFNVVNGG
ncbi:TPA: hypothetical protein PMB70_003183 [Vibrio cholerae]|nr:hypothetical protein [Vibrio cholerae]